MEVIIMKVIVLEIVRYGTVMIFVCYGTVHMCWPVG